MTTPHDHHDGDAREQMMQSDVLLVATAGASLLQGMTWSPVLFPVVILLKSVLAGTFLGTPLVITYLGSMLASALTLVLAGIPAALYERAKGLKTSNTASLLIWFAGVLVLVALPHMLVPR
jgi:hypothetical protein